MVIVSENALRHVLRKHRDITRFMGVKNLEELRKIITDVIENPDEVYIDTFRSMNFMLIQ